MKKQSIKLSGKVLHTNGKGWWSSAAKPVTLKSLQTAYIDDVDPTRYASFRLFFNTRSWNTEEDGLIYTDPRFLKELRAELVSQGLSRAAVNDLNYTEQGMQGADFVSLEAGKKFLAEVRLPR